MVLMAKIHLEFLVRNYNNLTIPIDYFQLTGNNHDYILRNVINLDLSVPFMNSTQSHSSPSYYGCHEWNNIPMEIRNRASLPSFKYDLKKYYIENYRDS